MSEPTPLRELAPRELAPSEEPREDPRARLIRIEQYVNATVLEMADEVRGFLCALLAFQHVLFVGPHGAAKSLLSRTLCDAFSWETFHSGASSGASSESQDPYFRVQLGEDSTAEDVYGPTSNAGFRNDTFVRNTTGMLPEARVALLEEIFDCRPALLRAMNTILNERLFKNGTKPERPVPLELLVGASNYMPEPSSALDAFLDRFMLRFMVSYAQEPRSYETLLKRANRHEPRKPDPMMSGHDLALAREQVATVDASPVFKLLERLRVELLKADVTLSPRRYVGLISIIKANAYLEGRTQATPDDLWPLRAAIWERPERAPETTAILLSITNPKLQEAQAILDDLSESCDAALKAAHENPYGSASDDERDRTTALGMDARKTCSHAARNLFQIREQARDSGEPFERIDAFIDRVTALKEEVDKECFGMAP